MLDLLHQKAASHPELRRPLTWSGARAIMRREGIRLVRAPIATPAALLQLGGRAVIVLNSRLPVGRQSYYVAHELAHLWAHGADEPVYYIGDGSVAEDREDEADLIATWMLAEEHIRAFLEQDL
jgi:Zn-dependent peptidase ImmA (M78 family)